MTYELCINDFCADGDGQSRESVQQDVARDTYVLGGATKSALQPVPWLANSSNSDPASRMSSIDGSRRHSNVSVASVSSTFGSNHKNELRYSRRKGPHEYDEEQYKKITFTRSRASGLCC